ncbi:hypothetical protein E0Z10_g1649 [Xylaria hypoxylon]|uniref:Uncharacterized protein n=1 Tax=Xylaria hypoxylon TaxID=37992 RepID=A0A4Z0YSV6_9PEZI|nr:hypothetical protein E0Z10_g1649 [Xylaria hypoxylon]
MTNPIQTPQISAQNNGSARAVQYLYLNQDDRASEVPVQRPAINVPIDLGYSMQRFTQSHAHIDDRVLRPLQYFATTTPLTEAQSRARMADILAVAAAAAAAAKASAPRRD